MENNKMNLMHCKKMIVILKVNYFCREKKYMIKFLMKEKTKSIF